MDNDQIQSELTESDGKEIGRSEMVEQEASSPVDYRIVDESVDVADWISYSPQELDLACEIEPIEDEVQDSYWVAQAKLHLQNRDFDNSYFASKEATRENPEDYKAWYVRAESAIGLKNVDDAAFSISQLQRIQPLNHSNYDWEVRLFEYFGLKDRAIRATQKLLDNPELKDQIDPIQWEIRRAAAIFETGEKIEAIKQFGKVYDANPKHPDVKQLFGFFLLDDAWNILSVINGSYFFSNSVQIEYVGEQLPKILMMIGADSEHYQGYLSLHKLWEGATKRVYFEDRIVTQSGCIFFISTNMIVNMMFLVFMLPVAIIVGLFKLFNHSQKYRPQWEVNRIICPTESITTGIQSWQEVRQRMK